MKKSIWDWLEIEPTKDINKIKAAYAEVAKKYHPTEHPEEFKQLRDSYKLAIRYAQKHKDDPEEKFFEEVKAFEVEEVIQDKESEIKGKSVSEPAKLKFDFSRISFTDNLSDRQKRMLDLFAGMISFASSQPEIYGHEKVMKAITYNWDRSPYKEEITPVFVSYLVDILRQSELLSTRAYEVIEDLIFGDGTDNDLKELHSQFLLLKNESTVVTRNEADITMERIGKCFLKLLDKPAPVVYLGPQIKALDKYKKKSQVTLVNNILLFKGKEVKYYFCSDLYYDIDKRSDALKIYDHNKKIIVKIPSYNPGYRLVLEHLLNNKSTYLGAKKSDASDYISKLDSIFKVWLPLQYKTIIIVICGPIALLSRIFYVLVQRSNILSGSGILHTVLTIVVLMVAIAGIMSTGFFSVILIFELGETVGALKKSGAMPELVRDIKKGKALYVKGGGIYIFDRYIMYYTRDGSSIDLIKNLIRVEIYGERGVSSKLKMAFTDGRTVYCNVNSCSAAGAVLDVLFAKLKEKEIIAEKEEKWNKYEKLKLKKSGLFISKYLIMENLKNTYQGAVMMIIIGIMAAFFLIYDKVLVKSEGGFQYYAILITFAIILISMAISGNIIRCFRRYHKNILIDAQIQILKNIGYHNEKYSLYILDDYFVSFRHYTLTIIPFNEIESVSGEDVKPPKKQPYEISLVEESAKPSYVLMIKTKDGKMWKFCNDYGKNSDRTVVDEIISELKCKLDEKKHLGLA
ncbi:hypothetical protein D6853_06610 [Butyrivibrio sp. X503]|uniref:hypothetical protein n=1 Tax=Butyrivibrio sp. X503 TaxID=2364878 RepID=UPI000EEAC85D|nr:hypothetical protein [Butyrivibrio sp. X503]RKM56453.1 hypothetical protein D6853_06610 [Butyrivibrio sp. X503]